MLRVSSVLRSSSSLSSIFRAQQHALRAVAPMRSTSAMIAPSIMCGTIRSFSTQTPNTVNAVAPVTNTTPAVPVAEPVVAPTNQSIAQAIANMDPAAVSATAEATSHWYNVEAIMHVIHAIQSTTGLPWWAAILIFTSTLRVALTPLQIKQLKVTSVLTKVKPALESLKPLAGSDPMRYRTEVTKLMLQHNYSPATIMFYPLLFTFASMFFWSSSFFAIKALPEWYNDFAATNFYWISSIAESDPLYILPVTAGVLTCVMSETTHQANPDMDPKKMKMLKWFMRILSLIVIPVAGSSLPSAVSLYWVANALLGTFTNLALRMRSVRVMIGLSTPKAKFVPQAMPKIVDASQIVTSKKALKK